MRQPYFLLLLLATASLAGGFFLRQQHAQRFPGQLPDKVTAKLERLYADIEAEAQQLLADSVTTRSVQWDQVNGSFLRTDSTGIASWSRSDFIPPAASLKAPGQFLYLSNQRGEFLIRKWPAREGYLVNILTLRDRYPIANGFLSPRLNPELFDVQEVDILGPGATGGEPIRWKGEVLFQIVPPPVEVRDSLASFLALLAGIFLLAGAIVLASRHMESRYGPDFALIFLILALYGMRVGMISVGIPAYYWESEVFDPRVFASSALNATLGDLLLNGLSVLILVIYLFRTQASFRCIRWILHQSTTIRFVLATLFLFLALLAVLLSYNFVEVVYHNSALTLDLSQSVNFSLARITAFLAVLVGTVSAFIFIHVSVSLSRHLLSAGWISFSLAVALAVGLFVTQWILTGNDNWIPLFIGGLMLLGIRVFRFDHLEFSFSFRLFLYFIFSLTLFSIHHSLAVRGFHEERLVRDQFRYAKDFLAERDVLGEYLLDQVRRRIAGDPFIQTRMASPFFSKGPVAEKIRRVHLNRYFDRYELQITTRGEADSAFQAGADWRPTDYEGIFFSGKAGGEAMKRYRVGIPIYYQRPVGEVQLELVLKRMLPDNVFPELLVDNRFSQLYRNRDFSFAVFQDGHLVNRFGAFLYERDFETVLLSEPVLFGKGMRHKGYYHVALDEGEGSVVLVSSEEYSKTALITNVSFWFVLGLLVLLLVQGLYGLSALLSGTPWAYTARIQLFLFLAFALPMVTVSGTVLTLMGRSSEERTTREFLDRSAAVAQRLAAVMAQEGGMETGRLEGWLAENAAYAKTDVSVFSPAGTLMMTSQPALYENQLVSTRMSREAFRSLVLEESRQTVTNEQIGSLEFRSAYAAVLSPVTGNLEAVISLPFFESASYFQRGQFLVLSNILQVFVVVFLVFTFVSFLAADSLAAPIRLMAKTLRQTTLSGENKPLRWEAKDEFGMLAQEYNRMVTNLDESRRALARQEKESAWREMAKQVAHEIKNPLTPMKLTLQKMEHDLLSGDPQGDRVRKSIDVLLRQVEILNTIASSFSMFGQLPAPAPQRMDFARLVSETAGLFVNSEEAVIRVDVPATPRWIMADAASVGRAVFNMLINAVQARRDGEKAEVDVRLVSEGVRVRLSISDNGRGIPMELQEKVFQPQFTTKASGSGLGLAMARQAVTQGGGKIWFESSGKTGTTFYVEFPIDMTEVAN
jgi:two-component system nitrogen regulation sensor histidine kinase NtrY